MQSRGGEASAFPRLLVLEDLTPADEGWYVCVVESSGKGGGKGRASASAWLRVLPGDGPDGEGAEGLDGLEHRDCRGNSTKGSSSDKLPPSAPRFTKPDAMAAYDAKPAGNMVRLRCPAFGELSYDWSGKRGESFQLLISVNLFKCFEK